MVQGKGLVIYHQKPKPEPATSALESEHSAVELFSDLSLSSTRPRMLDSPMGRSCPQRRAEPALRNRGWRVLCGDQLGSPWAATELHSRVLLGTCTGEHFCRGTRRIYNRISHSMALRWAVEITGLPVSGKMVQYSIIAFPQVLSIPCQNSSFKSGNSGVSNKSPASQATTCVDRAFPAGHWLLWPWDPARHEEEEEEETRV